MISAEQIEINKKKFIDTNVKYKLFTQELLSFLGDDFFIAPSSTSIDMFGCYPGGLLNHSLRSAKYSIKLNELLPEKNRVSTESILKCVFLSQIGKTFMFKFNDNEWQKKTLGKIYDFTENEVSMKSSERSIHYIMKYGVTLNEEEFQTILNLDKGTEDKMVKYHSSILSNIVKMGFELSIIEEKNG
jgi:hypothetical protein